MRHLNKLTVAFSAIALSTTTYGQDTDLPQPPAATSVVSSHQIDRYDAIKQLNASLKSDPNNLSDWVILGELAQEVAVEGPTDQAQGYFRLARQAYENALKLSPDNAGLKAAAQFARDEETNADQFNRSRQQATTSYLQSRRDELGQAKQPVPTVRVYTIPNTANATDGQAANANNGPTYPYGAPVYQPFANRDGQPYTYQQYNNGFFGPNALPVSPNALGNVNALNGGNAAGNPTGLNNNANGNVNGNANGVNNNRPMTLRQYTQQLPSVLGNEAIRRIAPGAATGTPTPGPAGATGTAVPPR